MDDESTPLMGRTISAAASTSPIPAGTSTSIILQVLGACLPMVALQVADSALMLASYSTLGSKFKQLDDVAWCMIAYQISVIFGQSIYSRLSDTIGRKYVMLWAHGIFLIGTVCLYLAPGFWLIVSARAIVGLGAAGMQLMLSTILNDISSEGTRSMWQALIQSANLAGQVLGGVGGGYIVDRYGWSSAFLCQLVYGVISFAVVWIFLRYPKPNTLPTPCNIPGAIMLALCLGSLVCLLDTDHLGVLIPLVLFIWFAVTLYGLETHAELSLIPWQRLGDKSILYIIGIAPITAFTDMSILSLVPYYIQASSKGGVMASGALDTLYICGEILGLSLCSLIRHDRYVFITSRVIAFLSVGIFFLNNDWVKMANMPLAGLTSGLANGASITMIMRYTAREGIPADRCILYGVYHLIIGIGNLFAQSVVSRVLRYEIARGIRSSLDRDYLKDIDKLVKKCLESFDYIDTLPNWIRRRVLASFLQAIQTCFVLVVVISAIGATLSILFGCKRASKQKAEGVLPEVNSDFGVCHRPLVLAPST